MCLNLSFNESQRFLFHETSMVPLLEGSQYHGILHHNIIICLQELCKPGLTKLTYTDVLMSGRHKSGGFLSNSAVKNSSANAGDVRDPSLIPGSGRSLGGGHGNPFQYSCLENPLDRGSLVGYSPYGHKESNTTEAT